MCRLLFPFSFFLFSLLLAGCHFDRSGPEASYVQLDSLLPGDANGRRLPVETSNRGIPDVSIWVDGQPMGVFDIDGTVRRPLTLVGAHTISVRPVVRADGLVSQRVEYPFYAPYEKEVTLTAGGVLQLHALVLRPEANLTTPLPINENFETAAKTLDSVPGSPTALDTESHILKPGTYGVMRVPAGPYKNMAISAKEYVKLPQNTNLPLYLELDYTSTLPMAATFLYTSGGIVNRIGTDRVLAPTQGWGAPAVWQRAYVFLSDEAASVAQGTPLKLLLERADNDPAFTPYQDTLHLNVIGIDNVRLLHEGARL